MKVLSICVVLGLVCNAIAGPYSFTNTILETKFRDLECNEPLEQTLYSQLAEVLRFDPIDDGISTYASDKEECPTDATTLCPYRMENIDDPDRIPSRVSVARCMCDECQTKRDSAAALLSCKPILRITTVLRKTGKCESGVYTYKPVDEIIPVACTCSRPSN